MTVARAAATRSARLAVTPCSHLIPSLLRVFPSARFPSPSLPVAFRPVLDSIPPPVRMALRTWFGAWKNWESRGNAEVPQVYQAGHLPHHRSGE
jgi:hypothetical protein